MKKALLLAFVLLAALFLGGCGQFDRDAYEVEQLRLIQVMGMDGSARGLRVILAASPGPQEESAPLYSGQGSSVAQALEDAKSQAPDQELFCGHLRQLLAGEDLARRDLEPLLRYVCRSADARLDMPLYLVSGGSAQDLMDGRQLSRELDALETRLDRRCGQRPFTAEDLILALEQGGGGPLWLVEPGENGEGLRCPGLAVIREGKLAATLDEDGAMGACFLLNRVGVMPLTLRDALGRTVSLEIRDGGTELVPLWEEGRLRGLEIRARADAALTDAAEGVDPSDETLSILTARLEQALAQRIEQALQTARDLETDYLGLGSRIALASPKEYRRLQEPIGQLLPGLELRISVRGRLSHGGDVKEAAP